ncbi:MAG: hypothetical protein A2509_03605 [Candidatus Edwardsbacteria bacterium RIFOXYD12_FULL_50_11]|uniref:Phage Gp37/Gp68 family protein n=1 Tax=Candidatus Edwardsbacteria bacterium GWF2_54_11 TaxID=1817851 RepID=A0A1F5R8X9_9BACT|nr:MAG: hypothetical protein A2502_03520 [Candidatus Edwardsbacteria bacterium RifOxyC12_full_54_24]OGF07782.1 MAG: hypothetical protein A2273_04770 [Candidatus Edwardsbacteria bacterium RifOxyA12_full_54_48]OGF10030.1 MAG: hypothetical protein A3K15_11180 [Candidatus Edwardsbacteria bacterium GWE2_54_12]OGF10501.1 MAG: hypothetical protein A2024_09130 [Candidatus Edwardsbacteria bacterium GWF2_54_11]OGF14942.1 MAG: hypothetical protein A2509_03605 [Candidatus Edwardsbacteria bacterium RIFOXYD1
MSENTKISWSEASWNPISGCSHASDGCGRCYAERITHRLQRSPKTEKYRAGFDVVVTHPSTLGEPARLRRPTRIFVCSMADLFHRDVPEVFIQQIFAVMNSLPQHQFQVLTKRSERMAEMAPRLTWTPNIWAGVTVESPEYLHRLDDLRQVPAAIRWISAEPLLSALPDLDLKGIHWVVAGGESGKIFRPMDPDWARGIRDQCARAGVAYFFKQYGGNKHGKGGDILDGVQHHEYPA